MTQTNKTLFRKNLDKRYISGEDLFNEINGLKKEMVITLDKFNDAPAFDQKLQKEIDKTALWLREFPNGKQLYKPCLLNVGRAEFLAKELANNSIYIDDCDNTIPFVIYAKPDRRHGYIVAFKKHYMPSAISDVNGLAILNSSATFAELGLNWSKLSSEEKKLPTISALKDKLKTTLV